MSLYDEDDNKEDDEVNAVDAGGHDYQGKGDYPNLDSQGNPRPPTRQEGGKKDQGKGKGKERFSGAGPGGAGPGGPGPGGPGPGGPGPGGPGPGGPGPGGASGAAGSGAKPLGSGTPGPNKAPLGGGNQVMVNSKGQTLREKDFTHLIGGNFISPSTPKAAKSTTFSPHKIPKKADVRQRKPRVRKKTLTGKLLLLLVLPNSRQPSR